MCKPKKKNSGANPITIFTPKDKFTRVSYVRYTSTTQSMLGRQLPKDT